MNTLMARRLAQSTAQLRDVDLDERLAELAASRLREVVGAHVLDPLINASLGTPDQHDLVGFEAFANKIHVSDYLRSDRSADEWLAQGIKYAETLAARLSRENLPFRVLLSRDPGSEEVTVRFFLKRVGQSWNAEDLEGNVDEVIQWDCVVTPRS